MAYLNGEGVSYLWNNKIKPALGKKVDIVAGKGLSSNDYTTEDKTKLAGIAKNAVDASYVNSQISDALTTVTQEGSWTPRLGYNTATTFTTVTPSTSVGRYIKIGKIVYIWFHIKCTTVYTASSEIMYLMGNPFAYNFSADTIYAMRGQFTWRFQGTIKTNANSNLPEGYYTTNQVGYSSNNRLAFSASKDQYITQFGSGSEIWCAGWYVAAT